MTPSSHRKLADLRCYLRRRREEHFTENNITLTFLAYVVFGEMLAVADQWNNPPTWALIRGLMTALPRVISTVHITPSWAARNKVVVRMFESGSLRCKATPYIRRKILLFLCHFQ